MKPIVVVGGGGAGRVFGRAIALATIDFGRPCLTSQSEIDSKIKKILSFLSWDDKKTHTKHFYGKITVLN